MIEKYTKNVYETESLGLRLAQSIPNNTYPLIALEGPLGSGKTHFVKGIAKGLKIEDIVNSPTYNIMKIYKSKGSDNILYHFDFYRLNQIGYDVDLEEYIYSKAVKVIEWANNLKEIIPKKKINIKFEILKDNKRKISISSNLEYFKGIKELL